VDNSRTEDLLEESLELFEQRSGEVEEGLDTDDMELLQLRKACRLLEAASFLEDEDGYYTVIIEASFAAIERTIQFYLLQTGLLHEDEYVNHDTVYERGLEAGLYGEEFREKLIGLWRNNRSKTYYREGVGTEERAQIMIKLAYSIHDYVLQLAGEKHECICTSQEV
jgi:hypothetical protein